jgi:hypothetical protein
MKIRSDYDSDPLLITGNSDPTPLDDSGGSPKPTHPTPPSPPPTEYNYPAPENHGDNATVTDVMDSVTDSVTAETLAGDGCDGCDGLFELASKNGENNLSSGNAEKNLKNLRNNGNMPSHPSQGVPETLGGDGLQLIPNPSHHPSQTITESITGDGTTEVVQNATKFQSGDRVLAKNSFFERSGTVHYLSDDGELVYVLIDSAQLPVPYPVGRVRHRICG